MLADVASKLLELSARGQSDALPCSAPRPAHDLTDTEPRSNVGSNSSENLRWTTGDRAPSRVFILRTRASRRSSGVCKLLI